MASNVFGIPITNQTLEAMPKYQEKEITATDRAYEALIMKSADNKDVNARKLVESLKPKYSAVVCTEIRVADHYKGIDWSSIYNYKLSKFDQYSNDMWNGCYSSVITGYSDVIDAILRRLGNNDAVMVDEAEFLCHQQLQNLYISIREAKSTHAPLARASINFGTSHNAIEKEREDFLKILNDQVTDVLRRRPKTMDFSMSCESSMKLQSAKAKLSDVKSFTVALGKEATAVMLSVEDQQ
ncbi:hypothetical protein FEM48_Zijuj11G0155400 [Ziziphus jujuba var. spinosa]|uniref:Uncharacterized protein n=1 Tax=Ziziphus jujuba var. spinosa TaxID=714518 RepID=A0A978UJS4_ZIZJJ|nr:hypothetical protein FEM48_Zijuj11G0155400 [Ziziphus jujuba var. spinosa]